MATLGGAPGRPADADRGLALLKARLAVGQGRRPQGAGLVAAGLVGLVAVAFTVERVRQGNRPDMASAVESGPETIGGVPGVDGTGSSVFLEALDRASRPELLPVGQRLPAPDFRLPDIDGGDTALADLADSVARMAPFERVKALPNTWVIDRKGRIAAKHLGLVDRRALEVEIRLLLDEGDQ